MVSNASEDFPEPDGPVITTNLSRGMNASMFLRLWTFAPFTMIASSLSIGATTGAAGGSDLEEDRLDGCFSFLSVILVVSWTFQLTVLRQKSQELDIGCGMGG